ncbi:hypothetical protein CR513_31213, partial [Mucuna pruriens]
VMIGVLDQLRWTPNQRWRKSLRSSKEWLTHIEFAYNRVVNSTTSHSPFELVYNFNLLFPLDLLPLPLVSSLVNDDGLTKAQLVKKSA